MGSISLKKPVMSRDASKADVHKVETTAEGPLEMAAVSAGQRPQERVLPRSS
jgi:hypothetical protein